MLPHPLGSKRDRLGGCNGLAEFGSFSFIRAAEPADAGGLKWLVLGQAGAVSRCKGAWHCLPASSCRAGLQGAWAEATGPYPRGTHLEGALLLIKKARKRPLRRGLDGCSLLLLFLILLLQFCQACFLGWWECLRVQVCTRFRFWARKASRALDSWCGKQLVGWFGVTRLTWDKGRKPCGISVILGTRCSSLLTSKECWFSFWHCGVSQEIKLFWK